MAAFYGTVDGRAKTTATREGSIDSGIKASVQAWDGSVVTGLSYNKHGGELMITIGLSDGSTNSLSECTMVYKGTLEDLKKKLFETK